MALLDEADVLLGPVPTRPRRAGRPRPSLDHVAERIIEERLPDCPRCGRPLEYLPGRGIGQRPAGLPGVQGHVRHDHAHG